MQKTTLSLTLVGLTTLAGCASWPGLDSPSVTFAPQVALLSMSGDTRMQSFGPPIQTNQPTTVEDLGASKRDEELAATLSYGDGFSGFDIDYMLLDMQSTEPGLTQAPWGRIPGGVAVNAVTKMDELRVRYIAEIYGYRNEEEDEESWWKVGAGIQLAHKEMSFTLSEIGTSVSQKIEIKDDVSPFLAFRVAGGRGPIHVTVDYAFNGDWSFGTGDLEGRFSDLSVRVSYDLEAQDLTLFGGYRRFDIPASGNEGAFRYDTDFTLDGWIFGFRFVF